MSPAGRGRAPLGVPGLEKEIFFSLSLVLARRERLRKAAWAASQKSPARPGVEGSGLPSSSSGCTAEGFSREVPGTRPPCPRRARSLPRTAGAAREGAGAGARRCAGRGGQLRSFPQPPCGRGVLLFHRWGVRDRRRFGGTSAVLPPRWNNADLSSQESIFPFQEKLSSSVISRKGKTKKCPTLFRQIVSCGKGFFSLYRKRSSFHGKLNTPLRLAKDSPPPPDKCCSGAVWVCARS